MPRKSNDLELLARRELRQKLSSVLQDLDIIEYRQEIPALLKSGASSGQATLRDKRCF